MSKNDKPANRKGAEPVASKHMTPNAIQYRIEYFEGQIKKKIGEREMIKAEVKKLSDEHTVAIRDKAPEDVVKKIEALIEESQNKYTVISTRIYALRVGMKRWILVKAERERELATIGADEVGMES